VLHVVMQQHAAT